MFVFYVIHSPIKVLFTTATATTIIIMAVVVSVNFYIDNDIL